MWPKSYLAGRFDSTDKRHDDRAKAIYANGDTYFGQYCNDRRQGVGLYLVAKGGGYAGSYAESKRSGQGVMRMPDGAVYQGEFAGDKFERHGQYEYVDGSTYVGAWKGGKKHGEVCGLIKALAKPDVLLWHPTPCPARLQLCSLCNTFKCQLVSYYRQAVGKMHTASKSMHTPLASEWKSDRQDGRIFLTVSGKS